MFLVLHPRRALLVCWVGGFLFLPQGYAIELRGLPDYDRWTALGYGTMMAVVTLDTKRLLTIKISIWDLPILVFILTPVLTGLSNGLGLYEGCSFAFSRLVQWGIPYFLGRIYFRDANSLKELAVAIFIGGLIYVPLCLFEIRMSPKLHKIVYGQHVAWGGKRLGGWRPSVFLDTGIALGMWMTAVSFLAIGLWRTRALKSLFTVPMAPLTLGLLLVTILCRSLGAILILAGGLGAFFSTRLTRFRILLILLALFPSIYMTARVTGIYSGKLSVNLIASHVSSARANSLQTRLDSENILSAKALQRPLLGWGRFSRNRVYDDRGRDLAVTDGLWVIIFGQSGLISLAAWTFAHAFPALRAARYPKRLWNSAVFAPFLILSILPSLYMIDYLLNAMVNPLVILILGALSGPAFRLQKKARRVPL